MSADLQWRDATEEPPQGRVLWIYFGPDHPFVQMGTWGSTGWRSALDPEVEYDAQAVLAWAIIEYPECPVRRWEPPT